MPEDGCRSYPGESKEKGRQEETEQHRGGGWAGRQVSLVVWISSWVRENATSDRLRRISAESRLFFDRITLSPDQQKSDKDADQRHDH